MYTLDQTKLEWADWCGNPSGKWAHTQLNREHLSVFDLIVIEWNWCAWADLQSKIFLKLKKRRQGMIYRTFPHNPCMRGKTPHKFGFEVLQFVMVAAVWCWAVTADWWTVCKYGWTDRANLQPVNMLVSDCCSWKATGPMSCAMGSICGSTMRSKNKERSVRSGHYTEKVNMRWEVIATVCCAKLLESACLCLNGGVQCMQARLVFMCLEENHCTHRFSPSLGRTSGFSFRNCLKSKSCTIELAFWENILPTADNFSWSSLVSLPISLHFCIYPLHNPAVNMSANHVSIWTRWTA